LLSLLLLQPAAGDSWQDQSSQPYEVLVALRFPSDPLFTRLLTQGIERQVHDQLTNFFGPLARVKVATSHPVLERFGNEGSETLAPADFESLELPDKTFVIFLSHADGVYRVAWRQLDAQVRHAGAWRSRSTPDRQWIGKAVCLSVAEDFAPLAKVTPLPPAAGVNTNQVQLDFQGDSHRGTLDRWLPTNTLLAPYWVLRQKDGSLSYLPIPHTVLRMGVNDGPHKATVISNQSNPWKSTARLVGFRALKLNTQSGHLRLRLVDAASGAPALRCVVHANTIGFGSIGDEHQLTLPDRQGFVTSRQPLADLAYIKISQGGSSFVQLPVPITSEVCELTCKVPVDRSASEKGEWERQLRYLVQDVNILQSSLNHQTRRTNELHDQKKYEEELRQLKQVIQSAAQHKGDADLAKLDLQTRAAKLKLPGNTLLSWAEGQLEQIAAQQQALDKKSRDLETLIQKMDAQSRADVLIGVAEESLSAGNIDEALEKFELALNEQPDQPKLRQRLERMKETWRIKSPDHEKARRFAFERWPATEVTEIEDRFAELENHLAALVETQDTLTGQKLLSTNNDHIGALAGLLDTLIASGTEEDIKQAESYQALIDRLAKFQEKLGQFIIDAAESGDAPQDAPEQPPAAPAGNTPPKAASTAEEEEVPPSKAKR
jgi:tetratricopeptide (TPR) repeat protein